MGRVQIITGIERRRRWSVAQKRAIVAAAFSPGAVVTEVARRAAVNSGQIYRWRHELRLVTQESGPVCGFARVVVTPGLPAPAPTVEAPPSEPVIEVVAGTGGQARIPASVSPELAAAVIRAMVGR